MDRRNFLTLGGIAAVAGATAVAAQSAAQSAPPAHPHAATEKMLMRRIPSSGEMIPAIGLGTSGPFEVGNDPAARKPLREVLKAFFAGGGTLIDTSPMYSTAEAVLGDLLTPEQQSQVFIATKVWTPNSGGHGAEKGIEQ